MSTDQRPRNGERSGRRPPCRSPSPTASSQRRCSTGRRTSPSISTIRSRRAAAPHSRVGSANSSPHGCAVTVSAGGTVAGDPGGDLSKQIPCITNPSAPYLPHDILIPMYDAAACQAADCNGNGPYPILGFAMFHVTGYSFNGNNYAEPSGRSARTTETEASTASAGTSSASRPPREPPVPAKTSGPIRSISPANPTNHS